MDELMKLLAWMPRLEKKDAGVAAVVGFLFGGIGLALYFRSVADCFTVLVVAITTVTLYSSFGQLGYLGGAVIAAVYGYLRVEESNRRGPPPNDTFSLLR